MTHFSVAKRSVPVSADIDRTQTHPGNASEDIDLSTSVPYPERDSNGSGLQHENAEDEGEQGDPISTTSFPTSISDITFNDQSAPKAFYKTLSSLRKSTLSIPNRLRSIVADSEFVLSLVENEYPSYALMANERCGSWYIPPLYRGSGQRAAPASSFPSPSDGVEISDANTSGVGPSVSISISIGTSAYFKSTDGHHGQWTFSQRRLNLQVLDALGLAGGVVLVDSTRRGKVLPDALRRTVPIWVAVWNRVLFGGDGKGDSSGKKRTFRRGRFQSRGLEKHEVWQIEKRIDRWANELRALDLNLEEIKTRVRRPLRCVWVINSDGTYLPDEWSVEVPETDEDETQWNTLVLCSASRRVLGAEMSDDGYIQGAGDDSESWANGLSAALFWKHKDRLMSAPEDDLPDIIRDLTQAEKDINGVRGEVLITPTINLTIASGHVDRSDDVPESFDLAICCNGESYHEQGRLLVVGCPQGKPGSKHLRDKLALITGVVARKSKENENLRLLVADETGRDLLIGVALAILCLFYDDKGQFHSSHQTSSIDKHFIKKRLAWITTAKPDANASRSTLQAVNSFLMQRPP